MNEVNTTALSERVKRLERQNKLIKLTGIVVVLGMAFVLLVGAKEKVPEEIVAEKFRVVNKQGRTLVILSSVNQEYPFLALFDENGNYRIGLDVGPYPELGLYDENRKASAILSVNPERPGLTLWDKNGELRAYPSVEQEGPGLFLFDENGKTVFSAP